MRNDRNHISMRTRVLPLLLGMALGANASAQTAQSWSLAVGANNISVPGVSDPLSAPSIVDSRTKVSSDTQPIVNIAYMVTDHVSLGLGLGSPYTHDLSGASSLQGAGRLGTLKELPPTLFGQYRFLEASSAWRPYLGLGLTYAIFYDEKGTATLTAISNPGGPPTTFKVDNAWGVTPQIGLTYAFDSKWFVDLSVSKTYITTTMHLSTGQSAKEPLNPLATTLSIGYRF